MARPLRIEGAGFWYNVVCRGNGGQRVFEDDGDREAFLARLGAVAGSFHVEIHAYALAVNMAWRRVATRSRRDKHLKRMIARLI